MQVTETQIDELTREYRVAVPAADVQKKVSARLASLAKTIRLPGFRPGKVPLKLVSKRFGHSVKNEAVEETINETSATVISDRGLRPATAPRFSIASAEDGQDLEYTMAVEILPEITPPDLSGLEFERLVTEVEEGEVEETLRRLAEATRGSQPISEPRPAQEGDVIVVDVLSPLDPVPFPGEGKDVSFVLDDSSRFPELNSQLIGGVAGDHKTLTFRFPADYNDARVAGQERSYDIIVKEIREREPLAIDDGLAQRVGAGSLDDLRQSIRDRQEHELKSFSRMRLKRSLLDQLDQRCSFAVPRSLVDREYAAILRQVGGQTAHEHEHEHEHEHDHACDHEHEHAPGETMHSHDHPPATETKEPEPAIGEEDRAEYRRLAERRVRLGLILAEIGRKNALQVTTEEVSKAVINEARRYPGQEKTVIEYFRSNSEAREALAAPIMEDKVIDFIVELAKVTERKVSRDELLRSLDEEPTSDDGKAQSTSS
jgi:trigger factor